MSDGGKGSAPRPIEVPRDQFESNWEKTFGKKKVDYQRDPLKRCVFCGSSEHKETCDSGGAIISRTTGCPVHDGIKGTV